MRTNARLPAVLVLAAVLAGGAPWGLLLRLAVPVLVVGAAAEQECVADGTCKSTTTSSSTSSSSTSSTSSTSSSSSSSVWPADQPYCALYLAESTIPGAGMGIFTVEEKVRGDTISRGDLCIPFIDMYWYVLACRIRHCTTTDWTPPQTLVPDPPPPSLRCGASHTSTI